MQTSHAGNSVASRETCTHGNPPYVYWLDENEDVIRRPAGEGESGGGGTRVPEHAVPDEVRRKLCRNH